MKTILLIIFSFFTFQIGIGQITVSSNSLPEINDVLIYSTFVDFDDSLSFKQTGQDLNWSYNGIVTTGTEEESYNSISGSVLESDFPSANMGFDFGGFGVAAEKTDAEIAILGFGEVDFGGIGTDGVTILENRFRIRSTPFSYGDTLRDLLEVTVAFSSALIPGLDSIELPLPGATLDSIRVTTQIFKTEIGAAWGELELDGNKYEVLKIEQIDSTGNILEVGLNVFGTIVWFDPSEFLGQGGEIPGGGMLPGGGGLSTTTHKFVTADSKFSIIEFEENRMQDSLGVISLNISGRIGKNVDMINASQEEQLEVHEIKLIPNPTSDKLKIEWLAGNIGGYNLSIFNLEGKLVLQVNDYHQGHTIDLDKVVGGNYIIQLIDESGVKTVSKLLINR